VGAETRDSINDDYVINNISVAADQIQGNYCCNAVVFYNSSVGNATQLRELVIPDHADFSLDGSPAEVDTGSAVDGGVLTITAWVRAEKDGHMGIIQKWNWGHSSCDAPYDDKRREWVLWVNNQNCPEFTLCDESANAIIGVRAQNNQIPGKIQRGIWTHIAITYDGRGGASADDGMNLYINGQACTTAASAQETGTYVKSENFAHVVEIGSWTNNTDQNNAGTCTPKASSRYSWTGQIAQIGFWRKALSAAEIALVYKHIDLRVIDVVAGVDLPKAFWRMGNGSILSSGVRYFDAIDGTGETGSSKYGLNYIFDQIGTHHAYARSGYGNDDDDSNRTNTFPDDSILPSDTSGFVRSDTAGLGGNVFPQPVLSSMARSVPMKFHIHGPLNNKASPKIYKTFIGDTENTSNF